MKNCLFLLLFIILFINCRQKNKQRQQLNAQSTDTANFFPVNDFIISDIKDIEQTPYYIYKITIHDNIKRDSSSITKEEYKILANQFLEKSISTAEMKPFYKESAFHDLSTKSFTITYTATDPVLYVKDVSVLLDDETNKLKRVFIHCLKDNGDSTIVEQYSWKAGKSFQINKSVSRKDGSQLEEQNFIVWNDNH
jgi:hypothetical protein